MSTFFGLRCHDLFPSISGINEAHLCYQTKASRTESVQAAAQTWNGTALTASPQVTECRGGVTIVRAALASPENEAMNHWPAPNSTKEQSML